MWLVFPAKGILTAHSSSVAMFVEFLKQLFEGDDDK